ncbi:MAG TPA: hypothetical protein VI260_22055, partial [Blastocatellia bacterium]
SAGGALIEIRLLQSRHAYVERSSPAITRIKFQARFGFQQVCRTRLHAGSDAYPGLRQSMYGKWISSIIS